MQGFGEFVDLPQNVVSGDHSSGKLSMLEALSGVHFPRSDTPCTRLPTEVVLRKDSNIEVASWSSFVSGIKRFMNRNRDRKRFPFFVGEWSIDFATRGFITSVPPPVVDLLATEQAGTKITLVVLLAARDAFDHRIQSAGSLNFDMETSFVFVSTVVEREEYDAEISADADPVLPTPAVTFPPVVQPSLFVAVTEVDFLKVKSNVLL
ncbi:hypothetical protein EYZ11_005160 [Aspergillus tanneri]|uniref:Dynamin N-terminal domain-containing protein n=1 Tax=Aspergillus tanneri TaxID=1220188 RepID=A0A4S3JIK9_9EURO|nr:uncharacterized protein ATNIH1004_007180 [Aspergillus tanneri]KAA8645761.1 hypothetical protein ATNIH1004_007180 [Aspergillus tanneri]THC95346.1 hypothetical protein EYZ11_005160 [Aspergillus tanneri]